MKKYHNFRPLVFLGLSFLISVYGIGLVFIPPGNNIPGQVLSVSKSLDSGDYEPFGIEVFNLGKDKVTIVWQTKAPSTGEVIWGGARPDKKQGDDRDAGTPSARNTHFTTLSGLEGGREYFFQVRSGSFLIPDVPTRFITLGGNPKSISSGSLTGKVLDPSREPINEAVIAIKGSSLFPTASFTTMGGNFVLPITQPGGNPADCDCVLDVRAGELQSAVRIRLSGAHEPLPAIIIGQNYDFRQDPMDPPASPTSKPGYDLNRDGVLNSLDLAIISSALSGKSQDLKFDLNSDGKINKDDVEVLKHQL